MTSGLLGTFFLVACRVPDEGAGDAYRTVTEAHAVRGGPGEWLWGKELAAGVDLDHDGVLEWATNGPRDGENASKYSVVRVFEGMEPVTERHQDESYRFAEQFGDHMAVGDVDGDGFMDLALSIWPVKESPRVYVLFDVDEGGDAALVYDENDDPQKLPADISMLSTDSGTSDVMASWDSGWYRIDRFPADAIERGAYVHTNNLDTVVADDMHRVLDEEGGSTGARLGQMCGFDGDGDGISESWFGGFWRSNGLGPGDSSGHAFVCDATTGLELPEDCRALTTPYTTRIGSWQAVGDLTGDGVPELITSVVASNGTDGEVHIFELDGTPLATIQGTHGAMFGWKPTFFVDDADEPWLLVGQVSLSGDEPGTVRAFRGSQLAGNVNDDDAARTFTAPSSLRLGSSMATYRQTPSGPVQLLLGNPYDGDGVVFVVPFEKP